MTALITDNGITEEILKSNMNGVSLHVDQAYHYAKDSYTLGLPEGKTTQANVPSKLTMATAVATDIIYSLGVIVDDFEYLIYEPYFEVIDHLHTVRGFNFSTQCLSNYGGLDLSNGQTLKLVGSTLSPDGLNVILSYEYWGPIEYSGYDPTGSPTIQHTWGKLSSHTESIVKPNTLNTKYNDSCLIVSYSKLNELGDIITTNHWWIYRIDTNIYPTLDNKLTALTADEYLPVIPLRYNNEDLTREAVQSTSLYITSKQLLQALSLNISTLATSINLNPNIAEIDHAYVMFGADLQSSDQATLAYLNHHFDYLGSLNTTSYAASILNSTGTVPLTSSTLNEHGLSTSVEFTSITTTYIPGKIDKGELHNARKYIDYTNYPAAPDTITDSGLQAGSPAYIDSTVMFDLQVSSNTIRRVTVKNLAVTNYVHDDYIIRTTPDMVKNDPANHNLIIPLEYNKTFMLSNNQRNALFTDCTLLVINSIVETSLDWYEEEWFAGVIMVATIIISVITFQEWAIPIVAALVAGEYVAALFLLVEFALIFGFAAVATNWLIRTYGTNLGIGLTILMAVAAAYGYVNPSTILTGYELTYGQLALQMSQAVLSATNEFIGVSAQKVIDEATTFTNQLKDAYDAMDANAEVQALDLRSDFNPLLFTQPDRYYFIPNEYPNEFFQRTIGLPDNSFYGVHDAIPDFVTNLLTLNKNTVSFA